jgi:7-cyano-7-deazaguanine tRNA-ribosyltransferase
LSFEVNERDLAGRIGTLYTRSGQVETPYLMPVVNPIKNTIPPAELKERFGLNMIITNSYLILKHYGKGKADVHKLINFDGIIMTDSGAYQLLIYGGVDTNPEEIVRFQEAIGSDIGVILDIPTGGHATREDAELTVRKTIERARQSIKYRNDPTMLWAGPVQGGRYLDLVKRSARSMGVLDFQTHPLGSPTQIMEEYDYSTLVDMIVTAKMNLPPERPLHLFGAGHPMMFALAVALGCDLFDSAAYALFAKDGRYMTSTRTIRLEDLSELPCRCPVCMGHDLQGLLELPRAEREGLLARHNLYVTVEEIRTIKQSIREGSLWELLETRCRSHPKLYEGFKRLSIYSDYIEANDPVLGKKVRGLFIYDDNSIVRPEVVRHRQRISERYRRPKGRDILVLLPTPDEKPFNRSRIFREARKMLEGRRAVHICFYGGPFSIIPSELAETFPLSQYESSSGFGTGWRKDLLSFMKRNRYRKVVMLQDGGEVKIRGVRIVRSLDNILAEVS